MDAKLTFKKRFETTNFLIPILIFVLSQIITIGIIYVLKGASFNAIFNLVPMSVFIGLVLVYLSRKCTGFKTSVSLLKNTTMLKEVLVLAILLIFIESFITIILSFFVDAGYLGNEFVEGNVTFSSFIIIDLISAIILAPISEELFFRGFLLNRLNYRLSNKKYGLLISIIITSLIFAICHGIAVFLVIIPFGFLSIFVYLKWNNLVASMTLHAMSNTIASIFGLLALYGIFDFDSLTLGMAGKVVFLILGAIAFYFIIKYMVDTYKKIV